MLRRLLSKKGLLETSIARRILEEKMLARVAAVLFHRVKRKCRSLEKLSAEKCGGSKARLRGVRLIERETLSFSGF